MFVGVKREKAVTMTASPVNNHFNKYNTLLYVAGLKNFKMSLFFSEFDINVDSQNMSCKDTNRAVASYIMYSFNNDSHFSISTENKCERPVSSGDYSILVSLCTTTEMTPSHYRQTYLTSWDITKLSQVITMRYISKACLNDYDISLLVEAEGQVVFIPKVTHDPNIYPYRMYRYLGVFNVLIKAYSFTFLKREV